MAILALFALAPSVGQAAPLLSGYGGPGSGSQAILGSTLIGGGGGTAGGGGGAASGSSAVQAGGELGRASSTSGSGARHAPTHRGGQTSSPKQAGSHGAATTPQGAAAAQRGRLAADASAGSWQVAGLSGLDLVYVLIVVALLALAGFFTGRLARRPE
ncbi:MAG TPA: hypothetical protein VGH21_02525 [Solirubrobacteraceae bacterium]